MKKILTVKELAEYLSISVMTVYRKVYNGTIPFFKINANRKSALRFRGEEIEAWIVKQTDQNKDNK